MIGVYIENEKFRKQIEYVFSVIEEVLGLEFYFHKNFIRETVDCEINICYLENFESNVELNVLKNKIVIINSKDLFSLKYLSKQSIPETVKRFNLNGKIKNKTEIISIYNSLGDLFVRSEEDRIVTNIDIVSDIFFMLSRYEEIVNIEKLDDEIYKRFPASQAMAFKNQFLHRPIVNEHIEFLWTLISKFNKSITRKNGWMGKPFSACLTHDVDWIEKHSNLKSAVKNFARLILKDKKFNMAIRDFNSFIKSRFDYKKDVYWTFKYITDIEQKYGFTSTFYFMAGGETSFDNKYKYNDKRIKELINYLDKNDFECGYHGSFNSYDNLAMMKEEKKRLDEVVLNTDYGTRQHFLRFKMPLTLELQEKLGFIYDCTLSFADREGFRCGICFPFKPYDIIEDRILDIWEIPLIVMETSIIDKRYSGYTKEEAKERVMALVDEVEQYGGVFSLLWHNSSLDNNYIPTKGWDKVYESIMEYLYKKNSYGSNGREIIKLYTNGRK